MPLGREALAFGNLPPPYAGAANIGYGDTHNQGESHGKTYPLSLLIYVVVLVVIIVALFRVLGVVL